MSEHFDEVGGEGNVIVGARAQAVAEYVVRELSDMPEAVAVDIAEGHERVKLMINADRSDMGRIIGRRGRTIQALRQVVRAAGAADGVDVTVDTVD